MGFGLEYQQPFFEDPTGAGDLLDEDEDDGWNGAYLPSAVEQSHSSRVAASTSPCSTYVSFFSSPSELVGPEALPTWTLSDSDSRISPVESPNTDFAAHGESLGDRHLRTLQISYEAVSAGVCAWALGTRPESERHGWRPRWPGGVTPRNETVCGAEPAGGPPWGALFPTSTESCEGSQGRSPVKGSWTHVEALTG